MRNKIVMFVFMSFLISINVNAQQDPKAKQSSSQTGKSGPVKGKKDDEAGKKADTTKTKKK